MQKDLELIANLEATCFPSEEAASKEALKERLSVYPQGFFVGEIDQEIIGFINGGATNALELEDDFFKSMDLHQENGKNLVVFGLDVHPDHRKKGFARQLMSHFISFARKTGKEKIILTCKDYLVAYYETFGYKNMGVSDSTHGGATWYDMILTM